MLTWVGLIPILPLIGFLITIAFGKRLGKQSGILATVWVFVSFALSILGLLELLAMPGEHKRALVSTRSLGPGRHPGGWVGRAGRMPPHVQS